jgi:tetratricopeptide (TPR) repeat protein
MVLAPANGFRILAALGLISITPAWAIAGDTAELTKRLQATLRGIVAHPLTEDELSEGDLDWIGNPAAMFADLGVGQVALQDLSGSQETAKAMFKQTSDFDRGATHDFVRDLTVALARAGEIQAAYDVLERYYDLVKQHPWGNHDSTGDRLAIARALAIGGDRAGAQRVCHDAAHALETDVRQRQAAVKPGNPCCESADDITRDEIRDLVLVARTQSAIGDVGGAQLTRRSMGVPMSRLPLKGAVHPAWLYLRTAALDWELGNFQSAGELLRQAKSESPTNWRVIAQIEARQGDVASALTDAARVQPYLRQYVFANIALILASRGNLDGAAEIVVRHTTDELRDQLLVELAKAFARNSAESKAIAMTKHIGVSVRRAQAVIEVAAVLAKRGEKARARELVRDLSFLRVQDFGGRPVGESFEFNKPETWAAGYISSPGGLNEMLRVGDIEDDLLAAAVRCRVALDGPGVNRQFPVMKLNWNVRKVAEAQGGEGDAASVLAWSDPLPRPKRIAALIGAARGHSAYLRGLQQSGTKGMHLDLNRGSIAVYRDLLSDDE